MDRYPIPAQRRKFHEVLVRVGRETIWHPDAIPAHEGAASSELKRWVLPAFDLIMTVMGLVGLIRGMPSFDALYDSGVAYLSCGVLLTGGVMALVGVAFPRLWFAEALGKLLMLPVIGGYATALWVLTFLGEGERWIVALAVTALLVLPLWTLARLGRERRARPHGGT